MVPEGNPCVWWLVSSPNHHLFGSLLGARGFLSTLLGKATESVLAAEGQAEVRHPVRELREVAKQRRVSGEREERVRPCGPPGYQGAVSCGLILASRYGTITLRPVGRTFHPSEGFLTRVRDYLVLLGVAGMVVALDQWTKYIVRTRLEVGEIWSPWEWLSPIARIVHWNNTGAAFGMFQSGGLIFTVVAIVVSLAILYYYPRVPAGQVPLRLALALQLGGAVGNLIDRLAMGTVTDFVSVGTFPVFNVADASISFGVALLVAAMWVEERRRKSAAAEGGGEAETAEVEQKAE